ncbi:MAG: hypothetical protein LIO93_03545 [Bacteroidales bacterium]|nr:hypothetical protein [Bacteroidales bacterium]
MARIRTIKPEFWEDEKVANLSFAARLFFIGLWNYADDQGVFKDNPILLKSKIFPYDDIPVSEVSGWLSELEKANILVPVFYNNEKYYLIRTFKKHQVIDKWYNRYIVPPTVVEEFLNPLRATAEVTPQEKEREEEKEKEKDIPPTPLAEVPPKSRTLPKEGEWKNDFKIYISLVEEAYRNLRRDRDYIDEREKFHPTVNIPLSLEKAYVEHWRTEPYWIQLKRNNPNDINWKDIFNKMLHRKAHKVWLPREQTRENIPKIRYTVVE